MFSKKFDSDTWGEAFTLPAECIGENSSGWTISGFVHEDYYTWVNEFSATHAEFGRVWGDFEKEVFADSEEGYKNFVRAHPPESWSYLDI